ncbi:unnamed protein product [Peniophora sp. CBMAI 1063]|nr:unnamed protein product [Peniophora sp. CBMAI 1063]
MVLKRTAEDVAAAALQPTNKKPRRPATSPQASDTSTEANSLATMSNTSDSAVDASRTEQTQSAGTGLNQEAQSSPSDLANVAAASAPAEGAAPVSGSVQPSSGNQTNTSATSHTRIGPSLNAAPTASQRATGQPATVQTPRAPVPLKSGLAVTLRGGGSPGIVEAVKLSDAFLGRDEVGERIWNMLRLPGAHPNAVNLAAADPTLFNSSTRYVTTYDRPPETAVSIRCRSFARALAVIRRFCGDGYFYVNTFRKGFSFTTGNFNSRLGDDLNAFRPVLTRDTPVPIYDGRERFLWPQYEKLPRLPQYEVDKGMVCAVFFTLGFYKTTPKDAIVRNVVRKTAGMNLQAVIILDNPNPSNNAEDRRVGSAINVGAVAQAPSYRNRNENEVVG